MADKVVRKKMTRTKIIIIIILVIGGLGAASYYGVSTGVIARFFNGPDTATTISKTGTEYKQSFNKSQAKIYDLIESGSEKSIDEATKIVDAEVAAAENSGNSGYKVDASLAKTTLLVKTGQAQKALDAVLLPLDQQYGNDDAYKYEIYASISWAYRELGDETKAEEYLTKIPGKGWDE